MTIANDKQKHEASFLNHWRIMHPTLPVPEREVRFATPRRWRFDFAWVPLKLAVELHGGGAKGRHTSVTGMHGDHEKANAAVKAGWRVLSFGVIALKDMPAVIDEVAAMVRQ